MSRKGSERPVNGSERPANGSERPVKRQRKASKRQWKKASKRQQKASERPVKGSEKTPPAPGRPAASGRPRAPPSRPAARSLGLSAAAPAPRPSCPDDEAVKKRLGDAQKRLPGTKGVYTRQSPVCGRRHTAPPASEATDLRSLELLDEVLFAADESSVSLLTPPLRPC